MGGRARYRRVVALARAAALVTGCGGGIGAVEERLHDELSEQLERQRAREPDLRESGVLEADGPVTPTVERVECPEDADTDPGASFRCRAVGPRGLLVGTLSVVMLEDDRPSWQFTAVGA